MQYITIRNREIYKLQIIASSVVALFIFFLSVYSLWGLFGFLLVILLLTRTTGVELDVKNKKFRKYTSFLNTRKGYWKPIKEGMHLVIMIKRGVKTTTGTLATSSLKTKGGFSELYLMNATQTYRFYINSSENHEMIENQAKELSKRLGVTIEKYNPRGRRR